MGTNYIPRKRKEPLYPHVPRGRKITTKVPDQRIEDLLTDAFEGGSNYWYIIKKYTYPPGQTRQSLKIEFPHTQLPLRGGSLTVGELEGGMPDKILDRAAIERGLKLMAEKYPKHWADFIAKNDDATTGDVFLQLCLYEDVIFG
ncbi:MAG: hypothetical protein PHU23_05985 [Dehalococcoidales bacterium]|nr:hypothetical protein [Dehalococcoidales bacterium]